MEKLSASNHVYSTLVALAITAVAWVGAFLLLFFVAELVSLFIKTGGAEGKKKKTQG